MSQMSIDDYNFKEVLTIALTSTEAEPKDKRVSLYLRKSDRNWMLVDTVTNEVIEQGPCTAFMHIYSKLTIMMSNEVFAHFRQFTTPGGMVFTHQNDILAQSKQITFSPPYIGGMSMYQGSYHSDPNTVAVIPSAARPENLQYPNFIPEGSFPERTESILDAVEDLRIKNEKIKQINSVAKDRTEILKAAQPQQDKEPLLNVKNIDKRNYFGKPFSTFTSMDENGNKTFDIYFTSKRFLYKRLSNDAVTKYAKISKKYSISDEAVCKNIDSLLTHLYSFDKSVTLQDLEDVSGISVSYIRRFTRLFQCTSVNEDFTMVKKPGGTYTLFLDKKKIYSDLSPAEIKYLYFNYTEENVFRIKYNTDDSKAFEIYFVKTDELYATFSKDVVLKYLKGGPDITVYGKKIVRLLNIFANSNVPLTYINLANRINVGTSYVGMYVRMFIEILNGDLKLVGKEGKEFLHALDLSNRPEGVNESVASVVKRLKEENARKTFEVKTIGGIMRVYLRASGDTFISVTKERVNSVLNLTDTSTTPVEEIVEKIFNAMDMEPYVIQSKMARMLSCSVSTAGKYLKAVKILYGSIININIGSRGRMEYSLIR